MANPLDSDDRIRLLRLRLEQVEARKEQGPRGPQGPQGKRRHFSRKQSSVRHDLAGEVRPVVGAARALPDGALRIGADLRCFVVHEYVFRRYTVQ